LATNYTISLL